MSKEANTQENSDITTANETKKTSLYYASLGALIAITVLFAVMFVVILLFPKDVMVEAGDVPNYSYITENPLCSAICDVVTDVRSIDTSLAGEQTVILRFFGFVDVKAKLTVMDKLPSNTSDQEVTDAPDNIAESSPSDNIDIPEDNEIQTTPVETDILVNDPIETTPVQIKPKAKVVLDVENILQNPGLPNGCEVVSLAILLRYMGYEVDPAWLFDNYMPKDLYSYFGNPWKEYIGDPRSYGFGCYAPCVVTTGNAYLADVESSLTVTDVSGRELCDYEEYIDRGIPVIIWGTIYMNGNDHVHKSWYVDGELIQWYSNSHCLVLIGYTKQTYVFCDPLVGVVEYNREVVEKSFILNRSQACVIEY